MSRAYVGPFTGLSILAICGCTVTPSLPDQDSCAVESDCALGQSCTGAVCKASDAADVEYWAGFGDSAAAVEDGGEVPAYRGLQGGSHTRITLRTLGFSTSQGAEAIIAITDRETGEVLAPERSIQISILNDLNDGIGEAEHLFVPFISSILFPSEVEGKEGLVSITITSAVDSAITAALVQRVRFIDAGPG